MTTLLLDIGNSRIKWAIASGARLGSQHALPYHGAAGAGAALRELLATAATRRRAVSGVLVVSVAGAAVEALVVRQCRSLLGIEPQFVRSERAAGGVRSGYRDVWRLGADRWVALLGARALWPGRAVCVADIGTALTIDLLDAQGRHRGGAIVPGPELMMTALLTQTRGIRRRARGAPDRRALPSSPFARDTAGALRAGGAYAAAAVIDRSCVEAQRLLGRRPVLLLTGGAAPALRGLLRTPHEHVADLVLQGLHSTLPKSAA